jgi:hypothetical protein
MDWSELFKNFAEAISPALQVLLQAAFVALAGQLSAWMYKAYQEKAASLSSEHQYILSVVVAAAVRSAEQLYSDGKQKRSHAFSIAEKALNNYGIKLDVDVIYAEIEAQVYQEFGAGAG